ncbi:MAG: hypothetical protein NC418_02345 [Muribaculaceae bacterium]|nr:hypothetical protein [Muribaculaceae bacterium]
MGETKVIQFPDSGAATNNSLAAMLPALLQNRGIDTAALMGMMNGSNGGFFGNNGGFQDIIALIVIAAIFGNGNFGFGGNGNNGQSVEAREMIMQTLNRNGVDIAALAQAVNTSGDQILAGINSVSQAICGLGNQMGQNTNSIITAMLQGNNALTSQLAQCCCDNKLAICQQTNTLTGAINNVAIGQERGFSALGFATERQTCDIKGAITDGTQAILAGQRAAEMREMQNKLDALREENSTFKASAMTSQIVGQATAPLGAALADLSARLAKIECNQPPTFPMPYCPASGNYVPVTYGINVNPLAQAQCGC